MKRPQLICLTITLTLLASACKVIVQVPVGGEVVSETGTYQCSAQISCEIDVLDAGFTESFSAVAADGYAFTGWKQDAAHFCGGTSDPCLLTTALYAGNDVLLDFLLTDAVFFLTPQFAPLAESDETRYEGIWVATNTTTGVNGNIALNVRELGDDRLAITVQMLEDLDSLSALPLISFEAERDVDGDILYNGEFGVGSDTVTLQFVLNTAGFMLLTLSDVPGELFDGLEVQARLEDGVGEFSFAMRHTMGLSVRGEGRVEKVSAP